MTNRRLSPNFTENEFRCRCCNTLPVDGMNPELITTLQRIRDHFGRAVKINSGHRCAKHNRAVGGSTNSQHILGTAADFVVQGIHPHDVFRWLDQTHTGGLGRYNTFTHIDVRPNRARW